MSNNQTWLHEYNILETVFQGTSSNWIIMWSFFCVFHALYCVMKRYNRGKVRLQASNDNFTITVPTQCCYQPSSVIKYFTVIFSNPYSSLTNIVTLKNKRQIYYLYCCLKKGQIWTRWHREILGRNRSESENSLKMFGVTVALTTSCQWRFSNTKVMVWNRLKINTTHLKTSKYSYQCLWTHISSYPNVVLIVKLSLQLLRHQ